MLTFTFSCGPLPSLPHPEIIVIFFKNTDVHSYTLSWVFFFCILCSKPMHVESQLPLSLKLTYYAIKTHYSPGSHPIAHPACLRRPVDGKPSLSGQEGGRCQGRKEECEPERKKVRQRRFPSLWSLVSDDRKTAWSLDPFHLLPF